MTLTIEEIIEEGGLNNALSSLSPNTIVSLPAMIIDEDIDVPNRIEIEGSQAGVDASSGSRVTSIDPIDETVFNGSVTLNGTARLDGVTLKAKPVIKNAKAITLENIRILSVNAPAGSHLDQAVIAIDQWSEPVQLIVDGCYFGNNTGVYNVFELNTPLKNGSSISNNYFSAAVGSHNIINIYAVEDNAEIEIKDNYFEKSASAARIGTKGNVTAVFNFDGNAYDATDMTDVEGDLDYEWAGLITIQPYGNQTISMKNITINIDDTIVLDSIPQQLFIYYEGAADTHLDNTNKPTIKVDGVQEDWEHLVHGRIN